MSEPVYDREVEEREAPDRERGSELPRDPWARAGAVRALFEEEGR